MSTAGIAKKLAIAPVTVRNHIQSILQRLDVHSKLAAVVYAYRHQPI
jgi:two-component system nitrate/nitrite response regulator NarL